MDRNKELERISRLLDKMGTRPLRSYGQNFLVERNVAEAIAAEVPEDHLEHIIEIGPGLGVLTGYLLERGANITAIEKDPILSENLYDNVGYLDKGQLEVVCGDAIKELDAIGSKEHFIVSNLPFNISSRLMGRIIDKTDPTDDRPANFKGALIMFQEEFTNRLISDHGSKEYGRISVMFRTKMSYHHVIDVPRSYFHPVPKVDASVIFFEPRTDLTPIPKDMKLFSDLVHVTFLNRRKKMRNSVNPRSLGMDLEIEDIRWILEDMDMSDTRPEDLTPEQFIELSNRLFECK